MKVLEASRSECLRTSEWSVHCSVIWSELTTDANIDQQQRRDSKDSGLRET